MKLIVQIVCIILLIAVMVGFLIYYCPVALRYEYSTKISVETPDKIENAISNVVSDLEKRDFVPIYMEVNWHPMSKTYIIYASGIDRTKISKYEP